MIQSKHDILTKKKQEVKGILSIAAGHSSKNAVKPIEAEVVTENDDGVHKCSDTCDEQTTLWSYCKEEVADGIQCNECLQWNHCKC